MDLCLSPTEPPLTPSKRRATDSPPHHTPPTHHPLTRRPHTRLPVPPKPPFNIYKSLLRHPNLFFQFALRLPYATIIALYSIDKEFHYRLNKFPVSLIHDYATYHAPLASRIFTWSLYPTLCISDPQLRPMDAREWLARDVPGFRWVGMVLARQRTVRRILTQLALAGHRVPARTEATLMKFAVLMGTRTSMLRRALLHDEAIWTDGDVRLFHLLLVKLDMRFSDPVHGNGVTALSRLLLAQPSLRTLDEVLAKRGRGGHMDYDDALEMLLRTYRIEDFDTVAHPWLMDEDATGVPDDEAGLLCCEGWRREGGRMETAVDMVFVEGIRRGLHVQGYLLDFVLYGTVTRDGENVAQPRVWRGGKKMVVPSEGWPVEEVRKGMLEVLEERAHGGGHVGM